MSRRCASAACARGRGGASRRVRPRHAPRRASRAAASTEALQLGPSFLGGGRALALEHGEHIVRCRAWLRFLRRGAGARGVSLALPLTRRRFGSPRVASAAKPGGSRSQSAVRGYRRLSRSRTRRLRQQSRRHADGSPPSRGSRRRAALRQRDPRRLCRCTLASRPSRRADRLTDPPASAPADLAARPPPRGAGSMSHARASRPG